jgi:cyclic-di-GMP-binding protein
MAIQTSPNSRPGALFFFDARSCKEWLKALPLTQVAQAQQQLLDALRILNRSSDFLPLERLTCMELMRDKVAFLLAQQRSRYAGKTLPLIHGDMVAWNTSNTLLSEMESGYRRCYQDAQNEAAPLGAHAALIIQRIIRYIGLGMLMAGFLYRRFDPAMWMRLHLQWIEAESRGLTDKKVKDSVGADDGYSSITHAYICVLLGQLANVYSLGPREVDFADAVLRRFAQKVLLVRDAKALNVAADTAGIALAVDLLANGGAAFAHITGAEHTRYLDVSEFSKSLRRRAKKLAEGAEAAAVDLPADWNSHDAYVMLSKLHERWCEPNLTRPMATIPAENEVILAFGVAETHFFLAGSLFEQPGVRRELSRQEMTDIAMFGRVSEATIRARYAEFNYGSETWPTVDESRWQIRVVRPSNSARGVRIGSLVGMMRTKGGEFYLSVIRELEEQTPGNIIVTLAMLPGKPEATAVRASDNKSRNATYTQGFRLPPMDALGIAETLIVPSNLAQQGHGIDIYHPDHGSAKQVNVLAFVERGVDFDRVTIAG